MSLSSALGNIRELNEAIKSKSDWARGIADYASEKFTEGGHQLGGALLGGLGALAMPSVGRGPSGGLYPKPRLTGDRYDAARSAMSPHLGIDIEESDRQLAESRAHAEDMGVGPFALGVTEFVSPEPFDIPGLRAGKALWKLGALASKPGGALAAIPLGAIPRGVADAGESLGGDLYSQLGRALRESEQRNMTVAQLRAHLQKKGVKKDEIDWSLEEHLAGMEPGDKLNLDDLQERVQLTQVDEVVLGDTGPNMSSRYAIPEVTRHHDASLRAVDPGSYEEDLFSMLQRDEDAYRAVMREFPELEGNENWADIVFDDVFLQPLSNPTKHDSYTLPGGENYQETLITLPTQLRPINFESWLFKKRGTTPQQFLDGGGAQELANERRIYERASAAGNVMEIAGNDLNFTGGHYGDTAPNVLVHVRHNDRTGPNGERVLFIEEIQDDWAKAGRKEGYQSADTEGLTAKLVSDNYGGIYDIFDRNGIEVATGVGAHSPARAIAKFVRKGVPDRPFKSTGHELALKRMIAKAINEGYDSVAWTPGHVQVARYEDSLRQTVDSIQWEIDTVGVETGGRPEVFKAQEDWWTNDEYGDLQGFDTREEAESFSRNVDPGSDDAQDAMGDYIGEASGDIMVSTYKDGNVAVGMHVDPGTGLVTTENPGIPVGTPLEDVVGKDIARQILEGGPSGTVEGDNLTIGGKGFSDVYDKKLVKAANKLGKKYGAKVETGGVGVGKSRPDDNVKWLDTQHEQVHTLKITPEMKRELGGEAPTPRAEAPAVAGARDTETFRFEDDFEEGVVHEAVVTSEAALGRAELDAVITNPGPRESDRLKADGFIPTEDLGGSLEAVNDALYAHEDTWMEAASHSSEAMYWGVSTEGNPVKVRVASHDVVYGNEPTVAVTFGGQDSDISLPEGAWVHPARVADLAVQKAKRLSAELSAADSPAPTPRANRGLPLFQVGGGLIGAGAAAGALNQQEQPMGGLMQ